MGYAKERPPQPIASGSLKLLIEFKIDIVYSRDEVDPCLFHAVHSGLKSAFHEDFMLSTLGLNICRTPDGFDLVEAEVLI